MWSGWGPGSVGRCRLLAALGWGLLLGACTSSAGADPTASTFVVAEDTASSTVAVTSTTTAASTTTSTTTPTTTTSTAALVLPEPVDGLALADPEAPAPPVDLVADTWAELVGVWSDIDTYWTWLNAHPTDDPDVLAVIFDPAGPEFEEQLAGKSAVLSAGLRLVAENAVGEIVGFGCCENPDEVVTTGVVQVVIFSRSDDPSAVVLNEVGEVTEQLPGWERKHFAAELRRSEDGEWRIWDFG